MKNNKGFTLVELLAVAVVMVVVSVIVTATITSSLRGTTKTNTINDVRQNGNYAIAQVSKMIEYAKSFNGVSNDNVAFVSNCVDSTPPLTPTPTPSQYKYIAITGFDNGQTIFGCSQNNVNTIASNSAFLIDTSLVSVDACSFTCERARITDPPIIGINFSLSKNTTSSLFENKASISFKTSVKMRNLSN
ncbi:MAG: prepilin-type N-terminal cleavage/methylation domain-containing protein [Patescibacteria group bacterium]